MFDVVIENLPVDVAIFSAAVADFKVKNVSENKIKNKEDYSLNLEKNIDIPLHSFGLDKNIIIPITIVHEVKTDTSKAVTMLRTGAITKNK